MNRRGCYGDVAQAMLGAAREGPATVRTLADRAQVGYGSAWYTATRLKARGELVELEGGRPAVLAVPPAGNELADKLDELHRSFWDL